MPRDTLFHSGRIHVRSGVSAEALLARDGRVAAVGREADLARDAAGAERVDLRGGLMTPGWFDAHVHFMWWGFQMAEIDLRSTKDARRGSRGHRPSGARARARRVAHR